MKRFLPSLRRLFGPKLNCKSGDLAAIVSTDEFDPYCREWVGRCVTVGTVKPHSVSGLPCWTYEPPLIHPMFGACTAIADRILRPITPPAGTVSDAEVKALFKSDTAPMVKESA